MGHSSLIGIDLATLEPGGRDQNALGPGDSSDTGSDMVGIEMNDEEDPGLPVDVALRDDMPHPLVSTGPSAASGTSDAAGTGERRSAASDARLQEASDIGVDRVFSIDGLDEELGEEDLSLIAELEAGDPLEDEPEGTT